MHVHACMHILSMQCVFMCVLLVRVQDTDAQPRSHQPYISRFISKRGCPNTVTFPEVDLMPLVMRQQHTPHAAAKAAQQRARMHRCKVRYWLSLAVIMFSDVLYRQPLSSRLAAQCSAECVLL
jgi:hypothetical protein